MSLYLSSKQLIERVAKVRIYRNSIPWGLDLERDLRFALPSFQPAVIFDVGANVGQTALRLSSAFKEARILSFEPVLSTYRELVENVGTLTRCSTYHMALGSVDEVRTIAVHADSQLSTFYNGHAPGRMAKDWEDVHVRRLDEFCAEHAITHVDFLKIDTEGHDLEVLHGASGMLDQGRITAILVEAVVNPKPDKVELSSVAAYLRDFRFHCVGFYDQVLCKDGALHFFNALFIQKSMLQ